MKESTFERRLIPLLSISFLSILILTESLPFQSDQRNRVGDVVAERNISTSWVHFPGVTRTRLPTAKPHRRNGTSRVLLNPTTQSRQEPLTTTTMSTREGSENSAEPSVIFISGDKDEVSTDSSIDSNVTPNVFDDDIEHRERILLPALEPNGIPDCATSTTSTFCDHVSGYPVLDIRKEVNLSTSRFREFFGSTSVDPRKSYSDDESSEERVCRSIPKIVYPQIAKNQVNQWVYIVNDIEYSQAVVAEVCEKEDKPCTYLDDNLPHGMYSRCRQKYALKKLLAVHPSEKRTYADTFQFPSCCACYVKIPSGFDVRRTLSSF